MNQYWYFFIFFVLTFAFALGLILFVALVRYKRHDYGDKYLPYECGVDPVTPHAREQYSVRFYLLTLVFIVFEVESIFLFPWAVIYDRLMIFGFIEMAVFVAILVLGYVYAWKADALDFRRSFD